MQYIEYVQTDGACWFDTGIIPDLSTKVELALTPITQRNYPWLVFIGAQNNDDSSDTFQIRRNNKNNNFEPKVDSQYTNVDYTQDTRYELSLDKDNFVVNGDSYSIGATSMDACNYTLFISAVHNPIWETGSNGSGVPYRASSAKFEEIKIYKNNVLVGDFRPANNNGSIGFYDTISQTFKANLGTGTPVAGPSLSSIIATASKTSLAATGETINISVSCENAWTSTQTGEWLTLSSTGDTGGTTITATAPSYSGATARETTITFLDTTTNDTAVITIKQKKYTSGQPVYLGGNEVTELYLGETAIAEAYLGEDLVFSSGPFQGLKISPRSISFNKTDLTKTVKVKSSESWTMVIPAWVSASTLAGDSGVTDITFTTTVQTADTSGTVVVTSTNYEASANCQYLLYSNPVPDNEMWYTADTAQNPYRNASWFTSPSQNAQGLTQSIVSNSYDSIDEVYKIVWGLDLECSAGSGFYGKPLKSVMYPDTFVMEYAENFNNCNYLTSITYGESATLGLQQGSWPPNLTEVYCRCKTEPYVDGYDSRGNYGRLCTQAGVFHYPAGRDWSTFIATLPNGWTAVDDL